MSEYLPFIILNYFGNFHILWYLGPILNHLGPIITIFNHFWKKMKIQLYSLSQILDELISEYIRQFNQITNEYPNILVLEKINEYLDEGIYWSKYIQIYSNIRIFIPHWRGLFYKHLSYSFIHLLIDHIKFSKITVIGFGFRFKVVLEYVHCV